MGSGHERKRGDTRYAWPACPSRAGGTEIHCSHQVSDPWASKRNTLQVKELEIQPGMVPEFSLWILVAHRESIPIKDKIETPVLFPVFGKCDSILLLSF